MQLIYQKWVAILGRHRRRGGNIPPADSTMSRIVARGFFAPINTAGLAARGFTVTI